MVHGVVGSNSDDIGREDEEEEKDHDPEHGDEYKYDDDSEEEKGGHDEDSEEEDEDDLIEFLGLSHFQFGLRAKEKKTDGDEEDADLAALDKDAKVSFVKLPKKEEKKMKKKLGIKKMLEVKKKKI